MERLSEFRYLIKRHPQVYKRGSLNAVRFLWDHFSLDLRYGTHTRGFEVPEWEDGHVHMAMSPTVFRKIFREIAVVPGDSTFIDLGSGRGAALILAHEVGFRDIRGVERSKVLYEQSLKNLAKAKVEATVTLESVRDYRWPDSDKSLVVFCYNSFHWHVLGDVIHDLHNWWYFHTQVPVWFIYVNAQFSEVVDRYMPLYKCVENDLGYFYWGIKVYRGFHEGDPC